MLHLLATAATMSLLFRLTFYLALLLVTTLETHFRNTHSSYILSVTSPPALANRAVGAAATGGTGSAANQE